MTNFNDLQTAIRQRIYNRLSEAPTIEWDANELNRPGFYLLVEISTGRTWLVDNLENYFAVPPSVVLDPTLKQVDESLPGFISLVRVRS